MKSIIDAILRLFGRETTIDKIVSPVAKVAKDLENYSHRQSVKAAQDEKRAEDLLRKSEAERLAAQEASQLASNYRSSGLMFVSPAE